MSVESVSLMERSVAALLPRPVAHHAQSVVSATSKAPAKVAPQKTQEAATPKIQPERAQPSVKLPATATNNPRFPHTEALRGGFTDTKMEVSPQVLKAMQDVQGYTKAGFTTSIISVPNGSHIHGPRGSRDIVLGSMLAPDEYIGANKSAKKAMEAVNIGLAIAGTAAGGLLVGYLAADIWFRNRLINPYMGGYGGGFGGYGGY